MSEPSDAGAGADGAPGNGAAAPPGGSVVPVSIRDEMRDSFLDYAMSVIISRALPDVRDGLKPVHRRALFAMDAMGNHHDKPFLKSARVVGDVIGKYHPHGDAAVYSTIVKMAQEFSMRYPLVDGQGNFGSIDGDSPAAMRYTEVRMKRLAEEMLRDLDKETVEWRSNYDDSLKEPSVLPTKIPNLLVNGSSGIAVGMATKIPPHNLTEVMGALGLLVDDESTPVEDLAKVVLGPDFPTGGEILGRAGVLEAYRTGKGKVVIRGTMEVEPHGKGLERIVVKDIPYQVNKSQLIEKVAWLVNNKHLTGITDIRDESSKEGMRICLDLRRGETPDVVINRLYKTTPLQVSFGIIFLSIANGVPRVMGLREQLLAFIGHRREVVVKRTIHELGKARERAHVLEGLRKVVEDVDAVVGTIRAADTPARAREDLAREHGLSPEQARAVLDMRLQRLTGLERERIVREHRETLEEVARLEAVLGSEDLIRGVIKDEFEEISEKYGDGRRTRIVAEAGSIEMEDLVKEEDNIVTVTHKGYIKRMPLDTYKSQRRGGTGVRGAGSEDDFFVDIFTANTHSTLLFFTDRGIVFSKRVYELPEGTRVGRGRNIANFISLPPGQKVADVACVPKGTDASSPASLVFATERGLVKRTALSEYLRVKRGGLRAIRVLDADALIRVRIGGGGRDVLLCSNRGKVIRFPEASVRPLGRDSRGVKGMGIGRGERIIGMEVIDDGSELLAVTENGYGKRTPAAEYRPQARGGLGIVAMKLTEKNGKITAVLPVDDRDDLVLITDKGQVIRTGASGVARTGRATQGVRIIRTKGGEKVVSVEKVAREDGDGGGGEGVRGAPPS